MILTFQKESKGRTYLGPGVRRESKKVTENFFVVFDESKRYDGHTRTPERVPFNGYQKSPLFTLLCQKRSPFDHV